MLCVPLTLPFIGDPRNLNHQPKEMIRNDRLLGTGLPNLATTVWYQPRVSRRIKEPGKHMEKGCLFAKKIVEEPGIYMLQVGNMFTWSTANWSHSCIYRYMYTFHTYMEHILGILHMVASIHIKAMHTTAPVFGPSKQCRLFGCSWTHFFHKNNLNKKLSMSELFDSASVFLRQSGNIIVRQWLWWTNALQLERPLVLQVNPAIPGCRFQSKEVSSMGSRCQVHKKLRKTNMAS